MPERKRLNAYEYNAFLSITGAYSELSSAVNGIESRAKTTPHALGLLRSAMGSMKLAMKELCETIPLDKLGSILKDLDHVITFTRVTYSPAKEEDAHRYVNAWALSEIVEEAVQYHCGMCDKCGSEVSKCEFRKTINSLFPFDIAIARNGVCSMNGSFGTEEFNRISTGDIDDEGGDHG